MIFLDLPRLNRVKFAILMLCYLSVVTFQCPTYKFDTDFLEIEIILLFASVGHLEQSRFKTSDVLRN